MSSSGFAWRQRSPFFTLSEKHRYGPSRPKKKSNKSTNVPHYNFVMTFEWDNEKNRSNQAKHGINFDTARALWDDGNRVEIQSSYPLESRNILIGKLDKKLWTAIFTRRGEHYLILNDIV